MTKLNITPWANGGCPEDFGWVFNNETNANAYNIGNCDCRKEAEEIGIPQNVLDAFEDDWPEPERAPYGMSLCDWLQAGN